MSTKSIGASGHLADHVKGDEFPSVAATLGKLLQSENGSTSREGSSPSVRRDDADYTDEVNELVLSWLMEDLDITAETCQEDPVNVFEDMFATIVSETPQLHRNDKDYTGALRQLLEWFFEDIESVARSFDLDPLDVLEDALKVVVSETSLADRMIEAKATYGTVFGER